MRIDSDILEFVHDKCAAVFDRLERITNVGRRFLYDRIVPRWLAGTICATAMVFVVVDLDGSALAESTGPTIRAGIDATATGNEGVGASPTNDELPTISLKSFEFREGFRNLRLSFLFPESSTEDFSFKWETVAGSGLDAAESDDYVATTTPTAKMADTPSTITTEETCTGFGAAAAPCFVSYVTIPLISNDDNVYEGNETFTLRLTDLTTAIFENGTDTMDITVTIDDSEDQPVVTVSDNVQASEASGMMVFDLTMTGNTELETTVAVAPGRGGTARARVPADFTFPTAVTIDNNTKRAQIVLALVDDADSIDELVNLDLTVTNAVFDNGSATKSVFGTITTLPVVSISTHFVEVSDEDYFTYTVKADSAPTELSAFTVRITSSYGAISNNNARDFFQFSASNYEFTRKVDLNEVSQADVVNIVYTETIDSRNPPYKLQTGSDRISVRVVDGTGLPAVGLENVPTMVNEGDDISATVSGMPPSGQTFNVRVTASDTGMVKGFAGTLTGSPVTLTDSTTLGTVSLTTNRVENEAGDGEITLEVLPGQGYKLSSLTATDTITVKDTTSSDIGLRAQTAISVDEESMVTSGSFGKKTLTIPVTRTTPADGTVSFSWSTTDGTAQADDDFVGVTSGTGTISPSPGYFSEDIVIEIVADDIPEGDETFTVTITNVESTSPSDTIVFSDITITVTITDDDMETPLPSSPVIVSLSEGARSLATGNLTMNVGYSSQLASQYCLKLTVASGASIVDTITSPLSATHPTIRNGNIYYVVTSESQRTLTVSPNSGMNGQVTITLEAGDYSCHGATVATAAASPNNSVTTVVGIVPVVVSINDGAGNEGDRNNAGRVEFVVNVDPEPPTSFDVSWQVQINSDDGDTAVMRDFATLGNLPSGRVTYVPGTGATISVPVRGNSAVDPDKTFTLNLTELSGSAFNSGHVKLAENIAGRTATGTIRDDDRATVSITGGMGNEGNAGANGTIDFVISVTAAQKTAFNVDWRIQFGTGAGFASFFDFFDNRLMLTNPRTGTLTFAADQTDPGGGADVTATSKTLTVTVAGDRTREDHEKFFVVLTGLSGAAFDSGHVVLADDPKAEGIILDDEPRPTLSISTAYTSILPGAPFLFTVTTDTLPTTDFPVMLSGTDGNGNALTITDFYGNAVFKIPRGEMSATFLATSNTGTPAALGTANVMIDLNNVKYWTSTTAGSISIPFANNTAATKLSIEGPMTYVNEGDQAMFTVKVEPMANTDLTAVIAISDVAGRNTNFVWDETRYVRIPSGTDEFSISVDTIGDVIDWMDGVIRVAIQAGRGYEVTTGEGTSWVEVRDDDGTAPAELTVAAGPAGTSVVEGKDAQFTVSRGTGHTGDLVFYYELFEEDVEVTDDNLDGTDTISGTDADVTVDVGTTATTDKGASDGVRLRIKNLVDLAVEGHMGLGTANYRVGTEDNFKVLVTERVPSTVTIESEYNSLVAGSTIEFTAKAVPAPSEDLEITISVADGGGNSHTISPLTSMKFVIPASNAASSSATGRLTTSASSTGNLTMVAVAEADEYLVGTGLNLPFMASTDPAVTVLAQSTAINDGDNASFDVTINPSQLVDLAVKLNVTNLRVRGYATEGVRYVRIPAGSTSATVTVATAELAADSPDGVISVVVQENAGYTFSAAPVYADVYENEGTAPDMVRVAAVSNPKSVVEGSYAEFKFIRDGSGTAALTVYYDVVENGDVTDASDDSVVIAENATESDTVRILTTRSTTKTAGQGVSLRVKGLRDDAGVMYRLGSPASDKIEVSEETGGGTGDRYAMTKGAVSGNNFNLLLTKQGSAGSRQHCITVKVDGAGDVVMSLTLGSQTATKVGNLYHILFDSSFTGGDTDTETITVTGAAGMNGQAVFTLQPQAGGSGTCPDNTGVNPSPYSVVNVGSVANTLVRHSFGTVPVITVTTDYESVVSGSEIEFTVTAMPKPAAGTTIEVEVTGSDSGSSDLTIAPLNEDGEMVIDSSGSATGVVSTSSSVTGDLRLAVKWDAPDYSTGADVVIPFMPSANPNITITGPTDAVGDGDDAMFTVTAAAMPNVDLAVKVSVADPRIDGFVVPGPYYVRIPATGTSATLSVPTIDKANTEPDGIFSASIQANEGYTGTPMAYVVVHQNEGDQPATVTVDSESTGDSVVEGRNAEFSFTRSAASSEELIVYYKVIDEGGATTLDAGTTTIARNMTKSDIVRIATSAASTKDMDSGVTLQVKGLLEESAVTYRVGATDKAKVMVAERVLPTVTIESDYRSLVAGSTIEFTAKAEPAPWEDLEITISVADGGSNSHTISPLTSMKFVIPASESASSSATGLLTTSSSSTGNLTMVAVAEADKYLAGTGLNLTFMDSTDPAITISGPPTAVNDGDNAIFTITAGATQFVDLAVKVNITNLWDNIPNLGDRGYVTEGSRYVRIPAGMTSTTLSVATSDKSANSPDGVVSVLLQQNAGYAFNTVRAYADVYENEGTAPDVVRVSAISDPKSVVEGSYAEFKFIREGGGTAALTVHYDVVENGEVTDRGGGQLTIAENATESRTIRFLTTRSTVKIPGNGLTVRVEGLSIHPLVTYRVGSSAKIEVTEELPVPGDKYAMTKGAVSGNNFNLLLTKQGSVGTRRHCIVIRVDGAEDVVRSLRLGNNRASSRDRNLYHIIFDSTFTGGDTDTETITVTGASGMNGQAIFTLQPQAGGRGTCRDDTDEDPSPYSVATVGSVANTLVRHSFGTVPVVTVATNYESVVAGSDIDFTVTAMPKPAAGTTITVEVTGSDSGSSDLTIAPLNMDGEIVIDSSGSATGVVSTSSSVTGDLKLAVETDAPDYTAGTDVVIPFMTSDNPEITIAGPTGAVGDGDDAMFTVTADKTPNVDLAVKVSVADPRTDGFVVPGTYYVRISATGTSATLSVPTIDKANTESDGIFHVSIQANDGYTGTSMAYALVHQDEGDQPATVTVDSESTDDSVVEGRDAEFSFTRSVASSEKLIVYYEVIDESEGTTTLTEGMTTIAENMTKSDIVRIETSVASTKDMNSGVTLRVNGLLEEPEVSYRVGATDTAKVMVTEAPVLTLFPFTVLEEATSAFLVTGTLSDAPGTLDFKWSTSSSGTDTATGGSSAGMGDYVMQTDVVATVKSVSTSQSQADCDAITTAGIVLTHPCHIYAFTIPDLMLNDNDIYEGDQTFTLTVSDLLGAVFAGDSDTKAVTVTIDDRGDLPTISVSDNVIASAASREMSFELEVQGETELPISVAFVAGTGGTADAADYTLPSSPIAIPADDKRATIQVALKNDADSQDETIVLDLTLTGATFDGTATTQSVTGTIAVKPVVSISTIFSEISHTDFIYLHIRSDSVVPAGGIDGAVHFQYAGGTETGMIEFELFRPYDAVRIRVDKDDTAFNSGPGTLTFTLQADPDDEYIRNPNMQAFDVKVVNGDNLPAVSLTVPSSAKVGGDIVAIVELSEAPGIGNSISVPVRATDAGSVKGYFKSLSTPVVVFNDLETRKTFTVMINDNLAGGKGIILVEVLPGAGYKLGTGSIQGGFVTDSDSITLSAPATAVIGEGTNISSGSFGTKNLTIPVTKIGTATGTISFNWSTTDGTAKAGYDFRVNSGTGSIAHDETSEDIVIEIIEDDLPDGDEIFTVTITDVVSDDVNDNIVFSDIPVEVTILDTDDKSVTLSGNEDSVSIAAGELDSATGNLTLNVSGFSDTTANYCLKLELGTGKEIVDLITSSLSTSQPVRKEGDVYYVVMAGNAPTLTVVPKFGRTGIAKVSVVDGDFGCGGGALVVASTTDNSVTTFVGVQVVDVSIANGTGFEGFRTDGMVEFEVSIEEAPPADFTVQWQVGIESGDTASNRDFVASGNMLPSGSVMFGTDAAFGGDGTVTAMTRMISVPILGNDLPNPDRTFTVTLTGISGAAVTSGHVKLAADPKAKGTIQDEDGEVVSIADTIVVEGSGGDANPTASFTVSISNPVDEAFSVPWTFAHNSTDNDDFVGTPATSGVVDFAANAKSAPIRFTVMADDTPEPDQMFTVTIGEPTGAAEMSGKVMLTTTVEDRDANGTIENDDGAVVSIAPGTGSEGATGANGTVNFVVSVASAQSSRFDVAWEVRLAGSGTANRADENDFVDGSTSLPSGTIPFKLDPGTRMTDTMETIMVPVLNDTVNEPDEVFIVVLTELSGAAFDTGHVMLDEHPTANGTIENRKIVVTEKITILAKKDEVNEGEDAQFVISGNRGSGTQVRISVSQEGNHIFTRVPNSVTIPSDGSYELTIPTFDNVEDNPNDGSITVTLLTDTATENRYELPPEGQRHARVDIIDNDPPAGDESTQYSVASSVIRSILLGIPHFQNPATMKDLPVISIAADSKFIEEGSVATFTLTASKEVELAITANVELTQSENFLIGSMQRNVILEKGSTSASLSVFTQDDTNAEFDGTIDARIRKGEDYTVGENDMATVNVSDAQDRQARQNLVDDANRHTLSQMAGVIGSGTLATAIQRLEQAFADGRGLSMEFGGNSSLAEILHSGIEAMDQGMQSWLEVLGDSSFEIGLLPEEGVANLATIWGLGDYRSIGKSSSLDGDVFTGHLGFDATVSEGMVAGLSTSISQFDMDYESDGNQLVYLTRSTGVHPYVGFESTDGNRLQIIAGYGLGEIELDQDGYETELMDSSFFNLGVGGELKLFSRESILNGGISELRIDGESWMTSQFVKSQSYVASDMRSDGRHLRISAVGTHEQKLDHGATIIPEVSLGLREDGMKHQSFLGMEVGAGVDYSNIQGYKVSSNGEMLLSGASQIQEWGVSGMLSYDSFGDSLGVLLELKPAWGLSGFGGDSGLWDSSILGQNFESGMFKNGGKVDAEIGYGVKVWEETSVFTPYGGIALTQNDDNEISLGSKLRIGSNIQFELNSTRTYQDDGGTDNEVNLETDIRW